MPMALSEEELRGMGHTPNLQPDMGTQAQPGPEMPSDLEPNPGVAGWPVALASGGDDIMSGVHAGLQNKLGHHVTDDEAEAKRQADILKRAENVRQHGFGSNAVTVVPAEPEDPTPDAPGGGGGALYDPNTQPAQAPQQPRGPRVIGYAPKREAGYKPVAKTVTSQGEDMRPEDQDAIMQGRYGYFEARDRAEQKRQAAREEESAALNEQLNVARERRLHAEMKRSVIDGRLEEERRELNRRREQVADMEVDPDKFFKDRGTWSRISAVIAAALGGYAKGLGVDMGRSLIEEGINEEIDAQKANIRQANEGVREKSNAYQELLEIHGDPKTAEAELRLMYHDIVAKEAQKRAFESESLEMRNNHDLWAAEFNLENQKLLADWNANKNAKVVEQFAYDPGSKGGPILESPAQEVKRMGLEAKKRELAAQLGLSPEESKRFIPGAGVARTDEDYKAIQEYEAQFAESMSALDDAEKLAKSGTISRRTGAFGYGTDDYHMASILEKKMQIAEAKSYGGVITEGDLYAAGKVVPKLTEGDSDRALKAIEMKRKEWRTRREAYIRNRIKQETR